MNKIAVPILSLLCLGACSEPGTLPGQVAVTAAHVEKGNGPLTILIEISSTENLAAEIQKLDSVTHSYMSCPLGARAVFEPKAESRPALIASLYAMRRASSSAVVAANGKAYRYQLEGKFEQTNDDNSGKPLPVTEAVSLLKRHEFLKCKIVVLRYFNAPYFTNVALLKTSDLIMQLENIAK